ncbi:MAG: hypothetical protein WD646_03165 [Actinomycetota bacterium]
MRVGEQAKVVRLERPVPSKEDRSQWEGKEGLLVRRLNVPWTPNTGELWEVRFDSGEVVVFSESELATVRDGQEIPNDMSVLAESWGDAPRTASRPFRRMGTGVGAAPAVLALLFFALAGILLLWAGVSSENWWFAAAGGLLVLIGVGAAGVLIS